MSASKADVLRMIEEGGKSQAIADITGMPRGFVVQVARENGYGLNVSSDRFQQVAPRPEPPQGVVRADSERAAPRLAPAPEPRADVTVKAGSGALIAEGLVHESPQVRAAADRASNALDRLSALLETHHRKAAVRAEVAKLEAELAKARAVLKPPSKVKSGGSDAAVIRAWAAANGVKCTRTGIIPKAVRQAYEAAHEDGAA